MNNKILTGIIIGGTVLTTTASAYAYGPQNGHGMGMKGGLGGLNPDRQAIMEALDNSDYQTWENLTKDSPRAEEMLSVINETNFAQFVEAHNLMKNGDFEGAKVIFDQLGIVKPEGRGEGLGGGEHAQAVKDALDNNDYSAWLEAIKDAPNYDELTTAINESNFAQLVEAHNLMESGDVDGAKEIFDQLGIKMPMGPKGGRGLMGDMKEIMDAVDNGDYETFISLIQDKPMADEILSVINESNFSLLKEMHDLVLSGNFDEAKTIADELGLKGPWLGGKGRFKGNQANDVENKASNRNNTNQDSNIDNV